MYSITSYRVWNKPVGIGDDTIEKYILFSDCNAFIIHSIETMNDDFLNQITCFEYESKMTTQKRFEVKLNKIHFNSCNEYLGFKYGSVEKISLAEAIALLI